MLGDEGVFQRWMRLELDTLHAGLVTQRRALADLLGEEKPTAPARNGAHAFEPGELRRLAARVPTELRYTLRLPMQVYADTEVSDALYVLDPQVGEALALLGYALGRPDARGRRWFARSLALELMRDWPTAAQMVYL